MITFASSLGLDNALSGINMIDTLVVILAFCLKTFFLKIIYQQTTKEHAKLLSVQRVNEGDKSKCVVVCPFFFV